MLNTIFRVNHNTHYEEEGTGQEAVKALRKELGRGFHHIVLVCFKNTQTGELVYPKIEISKKNK